MPNHAHKKIDTVVGAKMQANSYCYNLKYVSLKLVCGNLHLQGDIITRENMCGTNPRQTPDSSTRGELREKGNSSAAPKHWTYSHLNELRRPQERDRLRRP